MSEDRADVDVRVAGEATFRSICDSATEGILACSAQGGNVLYVNQAAVRMFGHSPADFSTLGLHELLLPESLAALSAELGVSARDVPLRAVSLPCLRRDGAVFTASIRVASTTFAGRPSRVLYVSDPSDGAKIAAAARSEANRYRALVETTATGYVILDPTGVVVDANSEYARLCGRQSVDEVIGRSVLEWTAANDAERNAQAVLECIERGFIRNFEIDHVGPDGANIPIELNATVVEQDGVTRILTLCRDVSQRHAASRAVRESEEMFRQLIEGAPEAIYVQTGGKISYVNSAACALFGAKTEDEILGRDLMERIHPDFRDIIRRRVARINQERIVNPTLEEIYLRLDGTPVPVEVSAVPVQFKGSKGALVFVRDITDRKRTEEALRAAQRLESVGVLAGGIAHDFNNLLTGVFGNVEIARCCLGAGQTDEALGALGAVTGVLGRARSLTQQLLTFSRGGSPVRKPVDLDCLIRAAVEFALSGSSLKCRFELDADLWWCDVDPNQVAQVLDNIAINACQAMPSGGSLHVKAHNAELEPGGHAVLREGPYVCLEISDTGVGISPELIDRVFDPFFSTKPQGTGLGLAAAYSIVRQHGGAIEVESTAGKGSTFRVLLPALPGYVHAAEDQPRDEFRGEGEILVLDDECAIVAVLSRFAQNMGFTVRGAATADDAVRLMTEATNAGQPIGLAILDLTIPGGRGGKDVVAELRAINPSVKVIVSSGYSEDPVMADPAKFGFSDRLLKPYDVNELRTVLKRICLAKA